MFPYEIFNVIQNATYNHSGMSGDWAVVVNDDDRVIFPVFQGSNNFDDWVHNFQFWPKKVRPYKNMEDEWYAHKGLVDVWHSIRDECISSIIKIASSEDYKDYCVCCIGHSHGGGLAQLCAEDLAYRGICCTYRTFGSPKVFYGKKTREHLDNLPIATGICYENGSDIVPLLPPGAFSMNPIHIGECFDIFRLFNTVKYHTDYGNPGIYFMNR